MSGVADDLGFSESLLLSVTRSQAAAGWNFYDYIIIIIVVTSVILVLWKMLVSKKKVQESIPSALGIQDNSGEYEN